MIIFSKEYDDESLYDLDGDIADAIDPEQNALYLGLPEKEGFKRGSFKVTIEWNDE